eukprot:6852515-Lingulodinium_polyedra.AAC.1
MASESTAAAGEIAAWGPEGLCGHRQRSRGRLRGQARSRGGRAVWGSAGQAPCGRRTAGGQRR